MNAAQWARVTALFDEVCRQPAAERESWLAAHCDDEGLRVEVAAMLRSYHTDPEFLEAADDVAGAVAEAFVGFDGRRLGAYRVVAEIGRGGMGVVYEARRDDEQFDRRAAIKILPAWSGSDLAERFRQERRVLAAFDHPGIGRLLDSGSTPEGAPYFVMEYVDGLPIDRWCRERELPVAERVALVERVCEAVAYAHQHLVVHRDIKPANILVTTDGQPKLLDFGIAALLSDRGEATAGMTRTGHQSFTPEYASPEQIRGERVTTASDVYSLGVVLYGVLTGALPYQIAGASPLEAMRLICEVEPPLMSAVAESRSQQPLRGDLDAIVAKALRKAPRERYGTITELATDLRAWAEGRPVTAARQVFGYRARRFARRHRASLAVAAVVAVALAGAGAATAWQARIARQERDKAQNRFREVRTFSRSLLFDVHEALRSVPGATESRRLLLDRAVQFLDRLAADAGEDDDLTMELAAGYERLANVQGNQLSENVGDSASAIASFEKAASLIAAVRARRPGDPALLIRAISVQADLAAVHDQRGDPAVVASRALFESMVRDLQVGHAGAPGAAAVLATAYSDIGRFRVDVDDFAGAEAAYRESVRLFEAVPPAERVTGAVRSEAYALKRLGAVLMRTGKLDESEQRYRQALALDEEGLRRDDRAEVRYDMTFTLSDLGLVQARRGEWGDAVILWRRALKIRQAAADADPKNTRAATGVATLLGRLGSAASQQKDFVTSATHYRDELRLRDRLVAIQGQRPSIVAEQAWARLNLAAALLDSAQAVPRDPARKSWVEEARWLLTVTGRGDAHVSVTAGSEPGFHELFDALTVRLARS